MPPALVATRPTERVWCAEPTGGHTRDTRATRRAFVGCGELGGTLPYPQRLHRLPQVVQEVPLSPVSALSMLGYVLMDGGYHQYLTVDILFSSMFFTIIFLSLGAESLHLFFPFFYCSARLYLPPRLSSPRAPSKDSRLRSAMVVL